MKMICTVRSWKKEAFAREKKNITKDTRDTKILLKIKVIIFLTMKMICTVPS